MLLDSWAHAWGVPVDAIVDLRARMGIVSVATNGGNEGSETRAQSLVRLDAAQNGVWLSRNNVGVLKNEVGVPVRFGLANESKAQNESVKSGDLIGIRPILIGPHHLGMVIGQFVSREIKHEAWTWTGSVRELAQQRWAQFVLSKGGDAAFCTGPGSFNQLR